MAKKMTLRPAEMTWLASAFQEKTKISPFTTIKSPGFGEEDKAGLIERGIINQQCAFTPESFAVLETLALADSFAGFHLNGSFGHIAKTSYFKGSNVATVDSAGEVLTVSTSVDVDSMAGILNEITGISRLVNAEVNVKTGIKSALAFATLIDITRKHALGQYAGYRQMPVGYGSDDLLAMLNQAEGSRWLSAYLKDLRLPGAGLLADEVEAAMAGLVETNLVEKGDYGYRLIGEAYDLAVNLLVIENILHVRCGQENKGNIVTGEALFLQGGLHDVLMLDVDAESVEFNTVSTYTMINYLQQMMLKAPDFRH